MKHISLLSCVFLLMLFLGSCSALREKNRQYGRGDAVLQASYWMLLSLQDQQFEDDPETRTAFIRFEEGGDDLLGFTGCNRISGRYQVSNGSLTFSDLSTTRAMCPIIEQENMLIATLKKADSYRISGEILTLFYQNKAVATFRAGAEPTIPEVR